MERLTTESIEDTGYEPTEIKSLEAEWNACRMALDSYRALGTVEEFRNLKETEQKSKKIEPWAVCFYCMNRRSPVCQKCTRNSFAPCGMEKIDKYARGIYLRGEI